MSKHAKSRKKSDEVVRNTTGKTVGPEKFSRALERLAEKTSKLHAKQKILRQKGRGLHKKNKLLSHRMGSIERQSDDLLQRVRQLQLANQSIYSRLGEGVGSASSPGGGKEDGTQIPEKVDSQVGQAQAHSRRLEMIEHKLLSLSSALEVIKTRSPGSADEPRQMELLRQRMDGIESSFANLEASISGAGSPGSQTDKKPEDPEQGAARLLESSNAEASTAPSAERQLGRLDEDVVGIKEGFASLRSDFSSLAERFDEIAGQTGDQEAFEQSLQSRVQDIENLDSDLAVKVDSQDQRFKELEERTGELEKWSLGPSDRDTLNEQISDIATGLKALGEEEQDPDSALQGRLEKLERELSDQQSRAAELAVGLGGVTDQLAEVSGHTVHSKELEEDLDSRVTGLSFSLVELDKDFNQARSDLTEQLERQSSVLEEQKERSTDLSKEIALLENRLADLLGISDAQEERSRQLEKSIAGIESTGAEMVERSDTQNRQIRDLGGRVNALDTARKELKKTLADGQADVDEQLKILSVENERYETSYGRFRNISILAFLLLLALGALAYWLLNQRFDSHSADHSYQMGDISRQLLEHEDRLQGQEQRFIEPRPVTGMRQALTGQEQGLMGQEQWNELQSQLGSQRDLLEQQTELQGQYEESLGRIERELSETRESLDTYIDRQESFSVATRQMGEDLKALEKRQAVAGEADEAVQAGQVQAIGQAIASGQPVKTETAEAVNGQQQAEAVNESRETEIAGQSSWLQQRNPDHYTIQVVAAYGEKTLEDVSWRISLPGPLARYQRQLDGKDWHVLLYGDFSSLAEARAALETFPDDIRAYKPWIRRLSSVQRDLASR
ncbi:MAG: hypothetical protein GY703_21415 [Gammaproteobacteria bacterium]|nr:hypothetical protein [Gammaproteobacteria bacterium]